MEQMREIRIARDKVYNIINYAKSHNVKDTEEYIEYIFESNEIYVNKESINQAYYQSFTKDIYIKGIENMYISIIKGAGDRYGSLESHQGTDINLVFPYDKEWITIFSEDEYQGDKNLNKIKYLINSNSLTKDKVINYLKSYDSTLFIYNVLSDDMKNDAEIKELIYDKLDKKAAMVVKDEEEYSDISPYGGMDVYVHDKQDIFLKQLVSYDIKGNEGLIKYMEERFCQDESNQKYIKDEMLRNEKMLYFFEHEDDYFKQYSLMLEQEDVDSELNLISKLEFDQVQYDQILEKINIYENRINDLNEKIEVTEKQIQKNELEMETINNKKYKIFEFYKRFEDNARLLDLQETQSFLQTSKDFLCYEKKNLVVKISKLTGVKDTLEYNESRRYEYEDYKESSEQINKELEKLNLKYDYDYLIKDNYCEFYDYYDGFKKSFELMKNAEPQIRKELAYLQYLDKVAENERKIKSVILLVDEVTCNVKNNILPTTVTLVSEENTIEINANNEGVSISINNGYLYTKENMEQAMNYIRENINLEQLVYHRDNSSFQEVSIEEDEEDFEIE